MRDTVPLRSVRGFIVSVALSAFLWVFALLAASFWLK